MYNDCIVNNVLIKGYYHMIYQIEEDEYSDAFPMEKEYIDWINCMEYDYTEPKLVVTNKTNIVLHKDNTDDYSPFSTINS